MITKDSQIATAESGLDLGGVGDDAQRRRRRHWPIDLQCGGSVQGVEAEPSVEFDDVPARGQICEVITRLPQDGPNETDGMGALRLHHTKSAEITEALSSALDLALGVKRKVGANHLARLR